MFGISSMRYTAVVVATIVLVLAGCQVETPVLRSAKVKQFEKGREVRTWSLTDDQLQTASEWLAERKSGWAPTPATFVPALTVSGKDANDDAYELIVLSEDIVLIGPKGEFMQRFPPEEIAALRRLLGAEP
jgi:hypothetical protein